MSALSREQIRMMMGEVLDAQGKTLPAGDATQLSEIGFRSLDFSELALRVEDELGSELNFDAPGLRGDRDRRRRPRVPRAASASVTGHPEAVGIALPPGSGNRIVADGFRGTWAELRAVPLPPVAAVLAERQLAAAGAAWDHARSRCEMLIVGAGRVSDDLAKELRGDGFDLVTDKSIDSATAQREAVAGRLWLLTSGSTGRPKRVAHTLQSLTTVAADQPPRRWLCPYSPGAYAWWQA